MNNIEKLLSAVIDPSQSLEDTLQQFATGRFVDTALGAQLDIIGRIVGQDREGMVDDDYRRLIRARIAVNNSDGAISDILTVAFLVVYNGAITYQIDNQGAAAVVLRLLGAAVSDATAEQLIKFLRLTVSAGVRVILEYSDQAPSTWFKWDTVGLGWDNGKLTNAIS